jgi:hypothetical protein
MKRSAQTLRTPAKLSAPVHQRLNLYALAAGATGAAIVASTPSADAEIVFTPAHHVLTTHQKITLDLNHDGIGDFVISNHAFCTADICGRTLRALPLGASNKVEGVKGLIQTFYASALAAGAQIGPTADFVGKIMAASGTEYGSAGQWRNVANRYLGFKFSIAGSIHFGWARFNVTSGSGTINATLTGYAYETVANKPIAAGKTKGAAEVSAPAESVPATPGMLAMGAPGLALWRRD